MAGLVVDQAAWASRWRERSVGDKALLCLGLLGVAVAAPGWLVPVVILVACCGLALGPAGVRPGLWFGVLAAPAAFLVTAAASVALVLGGEGGLLSVTAESLARAGTVLARGAAGTAAVLLLACTTPMVDVIGGLQKLRVPEPLLDIAALTYRLLFVLADVAVTVRRAQAERLGHDGFRRSLRSTALLASALLVRSWDRANRLTEGLAGRGFEGSLRTLPRPLRHSRAFVTLSLLGLAALAALAGVAR
ncbi:MAG: cobalt ECF transporter T component CbiQ [Propionibacteriaceae bacterium]|nr:cobalt ECF transporter T component CbiQ [Propionibacteriaceae bacterium]